MAQKYRYRRILALALTLSWPAAAAARERHLLYVAAPGVDNKLEFGGQGILVFDINDRHRFVKRIPLAQFDSDGRALNVKGIAANSASRRLYVTTPRTLTALNLVTDKIVWEKRYSGGNDRLSLTPDGKTIYLPSWGKDYWLIIDALSGRIVKKLKSGPGAHNTIVSLDGAHAYLASRHSPLLQVVDTKSQRIVRGVGPFGGFIRPFTVDGRGQRCYVCLDGLLGFEIGDLRTGRRLRRIEVQGFTPDATVGHGCPSHGIGMTPDEKEIWLADTGNRLIHIFDATVMPPKQVARVGLRDGPGWVTFSIDGRYAYASTGEIVATATRQIIGTLKDDKGQEVRSEKLLDVDFDGAVPIRAGDQFGLGRKTAQNRMNMDTF